MIFGGIRMTLFNIFLVFFLALWLFEGIKNIAKLFGEEVLSLNDSDLNIWETLAVVGIATVGGPVFSGWFPAFRNRPQKPTQSGSSLQTNE
jgi:hypothetical protein